MLRPFAPPGMPDEQVTYVVQQEMHRRVHEPKYRPNKRLEEGEVREKKREDSVVANRDRGGLSQKRARGAGDNLEAQQRESERGRAGSRQRAAGLKVVDMCEPEGGPYAVGGAYNPRPPGVPSDAPQQRLTFDNSRSQVQQHRCQRESPPRGEHLCASRSSIGQARNEVCADGHATASKHRERHDKPGNVVFCKGERPIRPLLTVSKEHAPQLFGGHGSERLVYARPLSGGGSVERHRFADVESLATALPRMCAEYQATCSEPLRAVIARCVHAQHERTNGHRSGERLLPARGEELLALIQSGVL